MTKRNNDNQIERHKTKIERRTCSEVFRVGFHSKATNTKIMKQFQTSMYLYVGVWGTTRTRGGHGGKSEVKKVEQGDFRGWWCGGHQRRQRTESTTRKQAREKRGRKEKKIIIISATATVGSESTQMLRILRGYVRAHGLLHPLLPRLNFKPPPPLLLV